MLAWDPPQETAVTGYRIYYRVLGSHVWQFLDEVTASVSPEYVVESSALPHGMYEFAVSSLDGAEESEFHCSMDDSADPATGWFAVWDAA